MPKKTVKPQKPKCQCLCANTDAFAKMLAYCFEKEIQTVVERRVDEILCRALEDGDFRLSWRPQCR